jgi:hypothetical protein
MMDRPAFRINAAVPAAPALLSRELARAFRVLQASSVHSSAFGGWLMFVSTVLIGWCIQALVNGIVRRTSQSS